MRDMNPASVITIANISSIFVVNLRLPFTTELDTQFAVCKPGYYDRFHTEGGVEVVQSSLLKSLQIQCLIEVTGVTWKPGKLFKISFELLALVRYF